MNHNIILFFILLTSAFSCNEKGVRYELYSNGKLVFEILPNNIEFYDTAQNRGFIEIHEMRLKEDFYNQDSFILSPPLELICIIDGMQYFKADIFQQSQSQPRLWVNFNFRSICSNSWSFPEQESGRLILRTNNKCNSIELFHSQSEVENFRDSYYNKEEYFRAYVDTARLAHEILHDPYYLRAIEESGISIK